MFSFKIFFEIRFLRNLPDSATKMSTRQIRKICGFSNKISRFGCNFGRFEVSSASRFAATKISHFGCHLGRFGIFIVDVTLMETLKLHKGPFIVTAAVATFSSLCSLVIFLTLG